MNDNGMIAPYSTSCLVNLFRLENTSQFKLTKHPNSIRMNDFLLNRSIPVTPYSNVLTFRDSSKSLKTDRNVLRTITNYNCNVTHSNAQDQKLSFDFGKNKI